MDLRLMESYERIEELRLNIEEIRTTLEMVIRVDDANEQNLGDVICLVLRDLRSTSCGLEKEIKALQRINGVGSDEGQEE